MARREKGPRAEETKMQIKLLFRMYIHIYIYTYVYLYICMPMQLETHVARSATRTSRPTYR